MAIFLIQGNVKKEAIGDEDSLSECNSRRQDRINSFNPICMGPCVSVPSTTTACLGWSGTVEGYAYFWSYNEPNVQCEDMSIEYIHQWNCLYPNDKISADSCLLPWGGSINSGSSVTAYRYTLSSTCQSQQRTCTDGTLSGNYIYGNCIITSGCFIP